MKWFQKNPRSVSIKLIILWVFVAFGCSQRNNPDNNVPTVDKESIISDSPGEKAENPDTMKLNDRSKAETVLAKDNLKGTKVPGQLKTKARADSVCRDTSLVNPGRARRAIHGCPKDTTAINQQRRNIITEFSELLFMYAKTTSVLEKEYFRTDAENKLNEIPGRIVDILPGKEIHAIFDDPAWSSGCCCSSSPAGRSYFITVALSEFR
jgi:hypothetical protein